VSEKTYPTDQLSIAPGAINPRTAQSSGRAPESGRCTTSVSLTHPSRRSPPTRPAAQLLAAGSGQGSSAAAVGAWWQRRGASPAQRDVCTFAVRVARNMKSLGAERSARLVSPLDAAGIVTHHSERTVPGLSSTPQHRRRLSHLPCPRRGRSRVAHRLRHRIWDTRGARQPSREWV